VHVPRQHYTAFLEDVSNTRIFPARTYLIQFPPITLPIPADLAQCRTIAAANGSSNTGAPEVRRVVVFPCFSFLSAPYPYRNGICVVHGQRWTRNFAILCRYAAYKGCCCPSATSPSVSRMVEASSFCRRHQDQNKPSLKSLKWFQRAIRTQSTYQTDFRSLLTMPLPCPTEWSDDVMHQPAVGSGCGQMFRL
jgi:hypothetical protein